MESLYDDSIKQFIHTRPWPKGLIVEVVEYEEYLALRLFRNNFSAFDGVDQLYTAGLIQEVINGVRQSHIPCYLEVAPGDGRDA